LNHYALPKFAKNELSKIFGVRRLTCFALDFSQLRNKELPAEVSKMKSEMEEKLANFNNIKEGPPSLSNYRYADDSYF
jgi:hypothetical protein